MDRKLPPADKRFGEKFWLQAAQKDPEASNAFS
jgi:hypothetical protein